MATDKTVNCASRDEDGDILGIGGSGYYHTRANAIIYIEAGLYNYLVHGKTKIIIKDGPTGKYLTTVPDGTTSNNLDDIKLCNI